MSVCWKPDWCECDACGTLEAVEPVDVGAQEHDDLDDLDDLLPDDLRPKKDAIPLQRTKKQRAAAAKRAAAQAEALELAQAKTEAQAQAARLAQIVNLHIAGFTLEQIGVEIGATVEEVDRMLAQDTQRYVRNQPALRTYVRNYVSGKYTQLLDAVWTEATDRTHREKLENQDRALRILDRMARLHGAEAPTQTEVKVDAAPEAVERLVNALAAGQGLGYDVDIFDAPDIVDAEIVHDAVEQSATALEVSGNQVEELQEGDEDGF